MPQVEPSPLYNMDAERAVLGSILIDPAEIFSISDFLLPAHFHLELHRWAYEVMLKLAQDGDPIDAVTLEEHLSRHRKTPEDGWFIWVSRLLNQVPTAYNIRGYASIVEEYYLRRRLRDAAGKVATLAHEAGDIESSLGEAELAVFNIRQGRTTQGVLSPTDYILPSLEYIEERRFDESESMSGLPTGLTSIDKILDGMIAPFPYVLAGRPGMGKSSLAIQIALHNALSGKVVLYFTPEMTASQLAHRMYSIDTGIPLWAVRHGRYQTGKPLSDKHMVDIQNVAGRISESKLFIDPTPGITPGQIRAKSMRCYAEHGVDLVIVDHLHEMQPDRHLTGRHLELGDMVRSLKEIGKLINAPVVIVAQLNRTLENRADKRPQMSDLRESGAIEEVAYAVLFVYRESYHNDLVSEKDAECIIAKNRDGETGTAYLEWNGQTTTFSEKGAADRMIRPSANGQHVGVYH